MASATDNEGFIDRLVNGEGVDKNVNTEDSQSLRAALRVPLAENAYIQAVIFTQSTKQDGKPNFDATAGNNFSLT